MFAVILRSGLGFRGGGVLFWGGGVGLLFWRGFSGIIFGVITWFLYNISDQ